MWVATVLNMDWPSKPGLPVAEQKAQYVRLLDQAKRFRFNAVIVQVRPTADAFWPSPFEPWSHWLTGVQGKAPGYDPLEFLIAQAHARGLELPPAHITLYTRPGGEGIGIHDARELAQLTRLLTADEVGEIRSAIGDL